MKLSNFVLLAFTTLLFMEVRLSYCGDGIVDLNLEQCDDGNQISGDGCSK